MKFISVLALLGSLSTTNAVQQQADIFYHQKEPLGASMWHFSSDGLTIYSPSGSVLKTHLKKSLCRPYTSAYSPGVVNEDCYFFDYASDGHKYVWVSSMGGTHRVEAFDIDSGDYAGYIETCSTPLDLKYHASREEMWLRCADKSGEHMGEIDVFSSNSLSTGLDQVYLNDTARPYGRIVVDSAMGNYGYVTAYNANYISEIDLSSKEVNEKFTIDKAYGAYDMTFSPVNKHIYFRTRVCCTCGASADVESCGRGDPKPVLVQTGPSASETEQDGVCSGGCEGSRADTIGVAEFDTVNKVFIANHNIKEGTGFGADPVTSPDGKHILLLPNDGGQNVRVLRAGQNGQASVFLKDIPVNFSGGAPSKLIVSDFAFVTDKGRNLLILGASTDNEIVLVDFNANFKTARLSLSPAVESTGGSSRKIEWAVGTDYVWVNGGEAKEQYVIDISGGVTGAKVSRTIQEVASGNMLFVNNYKRVRDVAMMTSIASGQQSITTEITQITGEKSAPEESSDNLGAAGLIVGCVSLVGVLVLAAYTVLLKGPGASAASNTGTDEEKFSDNNPETKTLGSKMVA